MFNVYAPDTPEVFRKAAKIMRERGLSTEWGPWVGYGADGTGDVQGPGRIGAISAIAMAKGASYEEVSTNALTASELEYRYLSQLEVWLFKNCLDRCSASAQIPTRRMTAHLQAHNRRTEEEWREIEEWYAANMADILGSVDLRRDLVPLSVLCQMEETDVLVLPEDTSVPTIVAAGDVRSPEDGNYPKGLYEARWSGRWDVDEVEENGPVDFDWGFKLPDFVADMKTVSGPDKIIIRGSELKNPLFLSGSDFFLLHVGELARRAMAIADEIRDERDRCTRDDAANQVRDVLAWDTARGRERSHLYQVWDVDTCQAEWVTAEKVADRVVISTPEERAEAQKPLGNVRSSKDLEPVRPYLEMVEARVREQQETMPMIPAATLGCHFAEPREAWMNNAVERATWRRLQRELAEAKARLAAGEDEADVLRPSWGPGAGPGVRRDSGGELVAWDVVPYVDEYGNDLEGEISVS